MQRIRRKIMRTLTGGTGILYKMTDATGIYLKYDWSKTMNMEDANDSYKLTSYVYSVGIRFTLAN